MKINLCPFCKKEVNMTQEGNNYKFSCSNKCFSNVTIFAFSDIEAIGYFNCRTKEIIQQEMGEQNGNNR